MTASCSNPWPRRYRYRRARDASSSTDAQPPGQRRFEKSGFVQIAEGILDRPLGERRSNAGAFDFLPDPGAASPFDGRRRPRDGAGHARVVESPLFLQARDRVLDRVLVVILPREPLPHLLLGQLPPPEHLQRFDVSVWHW